MGLYDGPNTYLYAYANPLIYTDPYGLFGMSNLPALPQNLVDFSAGFGDSISLGGTSWVRRQMGTNGVVDLCSGAYSGGQYAGTAASFGFGGIGASSAAKAFNKWLPKTLGSSKVGHRQFTANRKNGTWNTGKFRVGWSGKNGSNVYKFMFRYKKTHIPTGIKTKRSQP